jgi:hypothetical protein
MSSSMPTLGNSLTPEWTPRPAYIVPAILANAGENAATKSLEVFAAPDPEPEHA